MKYATLILGTLILLALISTVRAEAKCTQGCILPPKEYDRPYPGKLVIEEVRNRDELRDFCGLAFKPGLTLGCTKVYPDHCHVVLVPEAMIKRGGWTRELMLRHEIGHCNGWPGDHPGERRWDAK